MLTVYGIETLPNIAILSKIISCNSAYRLRYWNAILWRRIFLFVTLQQCLPFTVLKRRKYETIVVRHELQQCLPFTVLKRNNMPLLKKKIKVAVATVLTVYGIETDSFSDVVIDIRICCNSAYRLRYWNEYPLEHSASVLKGCNSAYRLRYWNSEISVIVIASFSCNSTYRLRYWNFKYVSVFANDSFCMLQQYLPLWYMSQTVR